jgi:hypothetical protein
MGGMNISPPTPESLVLEASGAALGDKRLGRRLVSIVEAVARSPGDSFPELAASDSELEATYRFFSNPRVDWQDVLGPHFEATSNRAAQFETIRVLHDPTDFYFSGESVRKGLGHMSRGQGFFGRFALALSPGPEQIPLGLLGVSALFRKAPAQKKRTHLEATRASHQKPPEERESRLWFEMAEESQGRLPSGVGAIHIMDRQADAYLAIENLLAGRCRFVIRASHDRHLRKRGQGRNSPARISEALERAEGVLLREVSLSRRSPERATKQHRAREARMATLHVRAHSVVLARTSHAMQLAKARELRVNAVQVFEPNPPIGEEPIEWTLLTTEPINTLEEMAAVVDHYRARWVIEEYFKALKTGCAYEKRQLESAHALLNALAMLAPIAWRLLVLRTLSRHQPDLPARTVFRLDELNLLRRLSKRVTLSNAPTVREAMLAIAGLGGHIKHNGDPGWMVLGRGYDSFLAAYAGWAAARAEK